MKGSTTVQANNIFGVMTAIVTVALVTTVVSSKYTSPILKSFGGAFADSLRAAQGN